MFIILAFVIKLINILLFPFFSSKAHTLADDKCVLFIIGLIKYIYHKNYLNNIIPDLNKCFYIIM